MTRKQSNGAGDRSGRVLVEAQPLGERVRPGGDEPADDVRVAAEVLRGRVEHEVGPQLQRPLEIRRGERVVDDGDRPGHRGQPGDGADVDDLEQRVRRRLDPHHARRPLARERGRDRVEIGQVDRIGLDPVAAPDLVGQAPRAAVDVVAHEQPVARIEQEADALGRRQARREREPVGAVLERRDRLLERGARRVAGAPVLVAAAQPADAVLLERGAHLDGGHHRAGLRVGLGARVDGEGLESVGHRRSFLHGRAADLHPVA